MITKTLEAGKTIKLQYTKNYIIDAKILKILGKKAYYNGVAYSLIIYCQNRIAILKVEVDEYGKYKLLSIETIVEYCIIPEYDDVNYNDGKYYDEDIDTLSRFHNSSVYYPD